MNLVLDTENSTHAKGNPFSRRNICCAVAWNVDNIDSSVFKFEHGRLPVGADSIDGVQLLLDNCDLLIGLNLKYDLHWLRRYGIVIPDRVRLWDTQAVQFVIENQAKAFPGMAGMSEYWGLQPKYDLINDYWSRGIDTPDIPWDIVAQRGIEDVNLTYSIYQKQVDALPESKRKLISLINQDLRVLAEMEWNGLVYDTDTSLRQAEKTKKEIDEIDEELKGMFGNDPINWSSNDHASVVLYGGTIRFRVATPYEHTYKGGAKAGKTETRYRHSSYEKVFPRLVTPLAKSELAKPGYWSTSEDVLKQLRPPKRNGAARLVELLRRRSDLEKLQSTYYTGFPKKIAEMDWEPGMIHSQLNQAVVVTGRLSSSGPNQQNLPPEALELVKSRYTD